MIASPDRRVIVSSLGWIDGDAIWCFDVASGQARTIAQNTGARYSSLHSSDTERFVVVHHFDGAKFMASVSLFSAPELTVSSLGYENGRSFTGGNADAWNGLPHLFVEYLGAPWNDSALIKIDMGRPQIQRLEWYDSSYDKDYQGVLDVIALPDPRYALISVQRSSDLIVHDLETGKAVKKVPLANRSGNPKLALRNFGKELWATDYDTLVVIETESLRVLRTKRLQGAAAGTNQFIGDAAFSPGSCCIARPYSGDVVVVDASLKIQKIAKLGRQPYEAFELPNGDAVARDWKTGDLLTGHLEPTNWLQRLFA